MDKKIIVLSVLGISIIAFTLLYATGQLSNIFKISKQVEYDIPDECGLLFGNILHNIKDDGACKIKCINKCNLLDYKYKKINFVESTKGCNICTCYCNT